MADITLIFKGETKKERIAEIANQLDMHIVYAGPNEVKLVSKVDCGEVVGLRHARIEAIRQRMAERSANKPEPKPLTLNNVHPLPVKPRKASIFRFPFNPIFDGPGAA